jgi:hypothetical protein
MAPMQSGPVATVARPGETDERFADDVEQQIRSSARVTLTARSKRGTGFKEVYRDGACAMGTFDGLVALAKAWERNGESSLAELEVSNGDVTISWSVEAWRASDDFSS